MHRLSSPTVVVVRQPGRKISRRTRRRATRRLLRQMRRRAARGVLGRIRLGTAGNSPRLRRWVLALALVGIAVAPYPTQGAAGAPPATCRTGCRAGSVPSMVRWTTALSGPWDVTPGLTGTAPASGLAYAAVGGGVAAVGAGLTLSGYSARTGTLEWQDTLTGFPAGAAIVSVRAWPGEVTAGVSYRPAAGGTSAGGAPRRTEVVISDATGVQTGRYPAATYGGAVAGSAKYTVVVGATAVTSYDNATGRVRWQRPTGQVAQAWRTDGNWLYVTESTGGFVGSAPVTALRRIDLSTGSEFDVGPLEGVTFDGALSTAFDGVVLFSSAAGVTAYSGTTGAWLWSAQGAVPEGVDHHPRRIYLTEGPNLASVDPQSGRVKATVSGSAVNGSAGVYVVRDGVALGLDQGGGGDAWGFDLSVQRVTLAASGLPWPHYFVDPSGVGGSADPASDLVVIAACTQPAPSRATTPGSSGSPSAPPASGTASSTATSTPYASPASSTASPGTSSSAPAAASQGCLRPELVGLNL